jgi:hypothetical protein
VVVVFLFFCRVWVGPTVRTCLTQQMTPPYPDVDNRFGS